MPRLASRPRGSCENRDAAFSAGTPPRVLLAVMNDPTPQPDHEVPGESPSTRLARAVLRDEPDALDAWFRGEHPRVWKVCFGMLADAEEADDVAQDAMLHLSDRLTRWDPERPYDAWRNTVVANLCRDRMRKIGARQEAERQVMRDADAFGLPDSLPDPAATAANREVREVLRSVLSMLSPREREVYVLRDLEGGDTKVVATALGITESSVRSILTLARRRLRHVIGSKLPGLVPDGGEA